MKSRAQIQSHPVHPILVAFPIAFFTGTVLCHVTGWISGKPELLQTAYYLNIGGIGFAVLAALPGLIDYLYTVPPKSSGKKRAAQHGILNTTMLVLFIAAFIFRRSENANHVFILLFELAGMVLMSVAGWMGGTLVYRNQIGVDQRYANAGKWNEAYFDVETGTIEVATVDELKVNAMKLLHVKNKRIVLSRTEDRYTAFEDRCPHKGGSLAGGSIMCGTVQCPWHGSQFDVQSGAVKEGPAKEGIKTFTVKVEGKKVLLVL